MTDLTDNPEYDHVVRGVIKEIRDDLVVADLEIQGATLPTEIIPASSFEEAGIGVGESFFWRINDIDHVLASELRKDTMELSEEDKRFCKVVSEGVVEGHYNHSDEEYAFYQFSVDGKMFHEVTDLSVVERLGLEESSRILVKYMLVDDGYLMISEIVEKLPDIEITDEQARAIKEEIERMLPDPGVDGIFY